MMGKLHPWHLNKVLVCQALSNWSRFAQLCSKHLSHWTTSVAFCSPSWGSLSSSGNLAPLPWSVPKSCPLTTLATVTDTVFWHNHVISKDYISHGLSSSRFGNPGVSRQSGGQLPSISCHLVYLARVIWNPILLRTEPDPSAVSTLTVCWLLTARISDLSQENNPLKTNETHDSFQGCFLSGQERVWR